jgi:hypothetical protein
MILSRCQLISKPFFGLIKKSFDGQAETSGAVAPCKKMVIGEKAGEKLVEHTIIPG